MSSVTFSMASTPLTGSKAFNGTDNDMQNLLSWASSAYQALVQIQASAAVVIGSISGTTLTVASVTSGAVAAGQYIYGIGIMPGTFIVSGAGNTWTLNQSQTVTSTTITAFSAGEVGVALATGTVNAWIAATQQFLQAPRPAPPPPMSWA